MMKTSTRKLSMLLWVMLLGAFPALAQQGTSSGNVSIQVTVDENGNVQRRSETRTAEEATDLEQILEQYGIADELKSLEPGEEVEIMIRRKKKEQVAKDIRISLDRDFEAMVPPPPPAPAKRPLLGVYYEVDPATQGGRVTKVMPNTAAQKAGMQQDDVIIEFDGKEIQGLAALQEAVAARKPGDRVMVEFLRDDVTIKKRVTLGENTENVNNFEYIGGHWQHMNPRGHSRVEVREDMSRPMLGIRTGNKVVVINGEEKENTGNGPGVYVSGVIDGTAASELGLQEGDRVLRINGQELGNGVHIRDVLAQTKVGDQITVDFLRDGANQTGTATLSGWKSGHSEQRYEFNFNSDTPGDVEIQLEELNEMMNGIRATGNVRRGEVSEEVVDTRSFRMVVRMEEVTNTEAEALSARSGEEFSGQSNLALDYFKVGPNPSNGMFNFSFELGSQGRTSLRVLDSNGTEVYQEDLGNFSGRYDREFDISQFAKGIYYLQITQGERAFTKKIVTQ